MKKSSIYSSLDISYYKNLSPRRKQEIFKLAVKRVLTVIAITLVLIVAFGLFIWHAFFRPNVRDTYENSKNAQWQQKVAEYKETGH